MEQKSKIIYRIIRPILYMIFRILYRPKSINKENIPVTGEIIIVGNHRHALDPCMIGMATKRTVNFLAKKELHEGIKKIFFKGIGTIPVDLRNKNPEATNKIEQVLRKGEAVGMFPEAKRNYTDEILLPFKYGTVRLAKKTNALIVPSGIKGEYRIFRKGPTIIFGEPFSIENMELTEANEYLMQRVRELIER